MMDIHYHDWVGSVHGTDGSGHLMVLFQSRHMQYVCARTGESLRCPAVCSVPVSARLQLALDMRFLAQLVEPGCGLLFHLLAKQLVA